MTTSTTDSDLFPTEPHDRVHRVLAVEARLQSSADTVDVYQFLVFQGHGYFRNITTANPKKHWQNRDTGGSTRDWLDLQLKALKDQGFTLTTEPFLVEATSDEVEKYISEGVSPRNIILRRDRVHKDRGVDDPTKPSATSSAF